MKNIDKTDDWESRQDAARQEAAAGGSAPAPAVPYSDPAPHPIDVARQRAADLVRNIADNTKLALRRRRDEIDNTIARIEKSEAALSHFIGEFARFNHEGLELATEVEKLIEGIATPFKADPPATLTQARKDTP